MSRSIYSLLLYLALPLLFLRLVVRSLRAPAYAKRWPERLGYVKTPPRRGGVWVHAVSVGETVAAAPMIKALQAEYPALPIHVTCMTPTGSERALSLFGDTVCHSYVPYDTPGAVKRFIARIEPSMLLVMETELWPNILHQSRRAGIPVIIANARLSQRSADGYARFPALLRSLFDDVSLVVAQARDDGERFLSLGLRPDKLKISGSIKFDIEVPDSLRSDGARLRAGWGLTRPVWIAASTHAGEEEIILDALRRLTAQYPDLLLVLVPRHPERFAQVANLCRARGFKFARRSGAEDVTPTTQVLLGDTMGELMKFYAAADLAFVGGSLVATGGHNFLEAAALGLPVLAGPHRFNFTDIANKLEHSGAMLQVTGAEDLAQALSDLIARPEQRQQMGAAGMRVVSENRGALQHLLGWVKSQLPPRDPSTND